MNKRHLILFGTVIACMITFSFFFDNFNDNDIEKTLTESMEETEKEHQKIEKLLTKVSQELEKNGYGEFPLRYTSEKRLLTIQVKDEKIADSYGKEIKELIHDVAKEIKYEGVNVQFETLDINRQVNKEDKKLIELLHEVSKATSDLLKKEGYKFSTLAIISRTPNPVIEIKIEGTEEYYNNVKDKIKKLVIDAVSSKTNINFAVKVNRKSENEIKDEQWSPIFRAIREEMDKKFEEYRGFAYSFHPEPLQIIIKTDLHNSKWSGSNKKVKEMEKYVMEIIKLKREELKIEEIPYEIIIRGRENEKLN